MLANIFKTSFRNLYREKFYSLIDTLGLAIAFCCFLVIFLYLENELSYDRHYPNHENSIY